MAPLDDYAQKVQRSGARGAAYPYEIIPLLTGPNGTFTEYDFGDDNTFGPVDRPPGEQGRGHRRCGDHADRRVPGWDDPGAMFGDPTKALGTVAGRRVRPIAAAVKLAGEQACRSSGSRCPRARRSRWTPAPRTWTAWPRPCARSSVHPERRRDQHHRGRHQRGRPAVLERRSDDADAHQGHPDHDARHRDGAHRQASLDYSGGVSAEDNFGIGGYDRVMGPNGEAQYWAPNLSGAVDMLFQHYEHAYLAPGERYPRRAAPPIRWTATSGTRRTCTRTARSPRSARFSPRRPTRTARSRSTSAR